jgi:hypothetical protein
MDRDYGLAFLSRVRHMRRHPLGCRGWAVTLSAPFSPTHRIRPLDWRVSASVGFVPITRLNTRPRLPAPPPLTYTLAIGPGRAGTGVWPGHSRGARGRRRRVRLRRATGLSLGHGAVTRPLPRHVTEKIQYPGYVGDDFWARDVTQTSRSAPTLRPVPSPPATAEDRPPGAAPGGLCLGEGSGSP